jgi:hypothetical protein
MIMQSSLTYFPVCPHFVSSLGNFAKQILLFCVAEESSKFLPIFKEAAKPYKGKVILYVCIDMPYAEWLLRTSFGIKGSNLHANMFFS